MNDIGEREREKGHLKLWNRNNPTPPSLCSISPHLHSPRVSLYIPSLFLSYMYIRHGHISFAVLPPHSSSGCLPLTNDEGSFRVCSFSYTTSIDDSHMSKVRRCQNRCCIRGVAVPPFKTARK